MYEILKQYKPSELSFNNYKYRELKYNIDPAFDLVCIDANNLYSKTLSRLTIIYTYQKKVEYNKINLSIEKIDSDDLHYIEISDDNIESLEKDLNGFFINIDFRN